MKTPKLKISYGERVVLDVPELEFEPGKVYALIGANGSGKTTFGKNCGFAYQAQKPYAFRMSVLKNLMLTGVPEEEALEALKELDMLSFKDERGDKLSGGETAKMALARSLLSKAKAIVLDEPTNSMDMKGSILAEEMIRRYADKGNIVLLITHSMKQAERIADETIFLKEGQINHDAAALQEFLDYYA